LGKKSTAAGVAHYEVVSELRGEGVQKEIAIMSCKLKLIARKRFALDFFLKAFFICCIIIVNKFFFLVRR
jgi:hypothetical protein